MFIALPPLPAFAAVLLENDNLSQSELEIDDYVNGCKNLGICGFYWHILGMKQKSKRAVLPPASPARDDRLAPITAMMSSRLLVLANLLKRGAILRYKRLAGLSSVEFGLVASLGRRPPMSVARLADAVGMDKGQISRALAGLVSRKLVSRAVNPSDNREVLVCLTRTGLIAHETIVAGALERNQRLLEHLGKDEVAMLLGHIDRLTDTAAKMLEAEKNWAD
jgi:DNA-binding MarR family transcriptional regulator